VKSAKGLQSLTEEFFYILAVTFVVLLGGAVSFYFLERGANKAVESIGSAVYWAFISMTTTGYGDISPSTAGGRVVAVVVVISGSGRKIRGSGIKSPGISHRFFVPACARRMKTRSS
jgi:voltage-gated potassium channel Kch